MTVRHPGRKRQDVRITLLLTLYAPILHNPFVHQVLPIKRVIAVLDLQYVGGFKLPNQAGKSVRAFCMSI